MTRIYVTDTSTPDQDGPRHAGFFTYESAEVWKGRVIWDGQNMADVNTGADRGQSLYRTILGRWVLSTWSRGVGEDTTYIYVDDQQARDWLLFNGHDDVVEKYFGE